MYDENGTLIENISEISDTAEQVYIGYKGYKFKIDNKLIITFMEKIEQNDEKIKYDKISDWSAKNIKLKYRALKALNSKNENYNLKLYNIYSSNKSGYFNGEDSYGEVKLNNAIKYNNTINYVIKPDQSVTNCCVFSDYSSDECLILDIEGDLLHIYCSFDYSNYYIIPKSDLYDGNIKYLTVVYGENAKEHQLYINGKPIEKTEDTQYWVISSTEYTNIGCRNRSGTMLYYKGYIYDINCINKKASQEEVNIYYLNEKKYIENNESNIEIDNAVFNYDFKNGLELEENVAEVDEIVDCSENNNNVIGSKIIYNKENKTLIFDGTTSRGEVKLNNSIKYNNTINYVIKPDQSVTNCCVFSDYSSDECLILDIEGDLLHIYCSFDYSNYYIIPKSDLYDGNIKYLTVVCGENAKEHQLYINGKPVEKTEDTQYWVINSTEYTNIGYRNKSGLMLYYKGEIYEITIYNHSLNQEEVETLYNEKIN